MAIIFGLRPSQNEVVQFSQAVGNKINLDQTTGQDSPETGWKIEKFFLASTKKRPKAAYNVYLSNTTFLSLPGNARRLPLSQSLLKIAYF